MKTIDLIDKYEDDVTLVNMSNFTLFGQKREFHGEIVTVKTFEDNTKAKGLLYTNGKGKVLVVDGEGSYGRALMGDKVAAIAIENGWSGVIIYVCIRDSVDIQKMAIGVLALSATPRRPVRNDIGTVGELLKFSNAEFRAGNFVYLDDDGMLL